MEKLLLAALEDVKNAVENLEAVMTSSPKAVTLEEVRAVLALKSKAGFTEEVKALIKQCGADKLTDIDPKHYASLISSAEAL